MPLCQGKRKDGSPCRSQAVLASAYCRYHQPQAAEPPRRPGRWTRASLEAAIAAHGGPRGLDLTGADLSGLDLRGMDLHGIVLGHYDEASREFVGANLAQADLREANLQGAEMLRANLREARLERANLQKANLWYAQLQGAILSPARLRGANLKRADLQRANLQFADLQEANLHSAHLQGANLEFANLQGTDLRATELQGAILISANLQGADLRKANLAEVDLKDVDQEGLLRVRFHQARLARTTLRRSQLGPAIQEETSGDCDAARDTYLALKRNFEEIGDYAGASWCYVKERQMEKGCSAPWRARASFGAEQLGDSSQSRLPWYHPHVARFYIRHTTKWLLDWVVELICNYGESPLRTLATMLLVFVAFAVLYGVTGAVQVVGQPGSSPTPLDLFVFALGAFATMSPGSVRPAPNQSWVDIAQGIEALVGVALTGLLGFVLGNRIRRN